MRILLSRWVLGFVGVALLGSLVWLLGPLLPALENALPRAAVVAAMLLVWAVANAALDWRSRARDAALARCAVLADPDAAASAEESAALRDKLGEALALLRHARGSLYDQPWYVIIGPPGAGKTTALLNAGLRFPLAGKMGHGAVAGVGGTRLCDWWFTDDAVLIDTAGRYTTRESNAAVDRAGWHTFLDLLKRTRPRQPLNGVLVAIALPDIAQAPRDERMAHAAAIRGRLNELRDRLGVRLPVYALFTKADLIAGFSEFFDDLNAEQRAQVWGMTFPLAHANGDPLGGFPASFAALVERLDARLLDRMQTERSPDRRALIAGFPAQIASLAAPVQEFLSAAFAGSRLDPAPLLRGAYLVSGTQEGTPIDRLTGVLARSFGVDQRRAPSLRPDHGRGYFLGRLLRQVVLGEAMLVSEPPAAARRRVLVRAGAHAGVLLAALGGGGLLWGAAAMNQSAIGQAAASLDRVRQAAARLPLDPVAADDLPTVVPLLDQARALPRDGGGGLAELGLSQSGKLAAAGRLVYRHALERVLLPRLIVRLEGQLRAALSRPDTLYEATRVYLMLGGAGPLDRDLVRAWMALDWEQAFPGATNADLRASLSGHLDALLAEPLPAIALDGALVEEARAIFSRVPLAQRVYSRIVLSAAAQRAAPWRPADALGAAGARLFLRASGKPLTDGVPGLYTAAGFRDVLLAALPLAARQVAAESWVLGRQAAADAAQVPALEQDVVRLYEADDVKQWDGVLADLNLAPAHSVQQAAEQLFVLASPQSPLRDLLGAITRQLTLVAAAPAAPVQPVSAEVKQALGQPAPASPDGGEVDAHFRALRAYAGAPLDAALKAVDAVQQDLAQLAGAPPGAAPPAATGGDKLLALRAEAGQAPQPVQRWLLAMAAEAASLRAGGARAQVLAAFNGGGGPAALCSRAVSGRYPFSPTASAGIPLDDFVRLFAPGGLLDGFFNAQLRPFVDTSGATWKIADGDAAPPVSGAELAQFQRAAAIRDMFFPAGAAPTLRFEVTPLDLDPGARQVTLDLGGASVSYAHGPARATAVSWPAAGGSAARLVFDPPAPGAALQASGPWALFRLIGQGSLQAQGSSDSYTLTFQQGERRAVFAVRAGSVLNPLAPGVLQDFRCPALR
jgi:type VI secretion system protein ImpL